MINDWIEAGRILKNDGVVILPTDTLYGIIGSAMSKKAVKKIYDLKGRTETKPFIVLINSYEQLKIFGSRTSEYLGKLWPGKVSVILSCNSKKWEYIHRGTKSIAFRMIGKRNKNLFNLINKVGPLVAPSANPEGLPPAETILKAKEYFSPKQGLGPELYINGGKRHFKPSTLVRLIGNNFEILRQGEVKVNLK